MLCLLRRVVPAAFLVLTIFAGPAWAECAWVLWDRVLRTPGPDINWEPMSGHVGKLDCDAAMKAEIERIAAVGGRVRVEHGSVIADMTVNPKEQVVIIRQFRCLPDTIDPRGPKGGGR